MKGYAGFTLTLIVVWFAVVLTASALQVFANTANGIGIAVAVAASVPLIVFAAWYALSQSSGSSCCRSTPRF